MHFSIHLATNEAYLFMKKMLPPYIVNCFMATGYDTLDVLAEINDESLAEIEEIVNNEYSCFRHQPMVTKKEFVINTDALLFIQNLLVISATGSNNNPLQWSRKMFLFGGPTSMHIMHL